MVSRCFSDGSVGVGAFATGLCQISSFFITPSLLAAACLGTFESIFSIFETTVFDEGSMMRVHYPKWEYGPYC